MCKFGHIVLGLLLTFVISACNRDAPQQSNIGKPGKETPPTLPKNGDQKVKELAGQSTWKWRSQYYGFEVTVPSEWVLNPNAKLLAFFTRFKPRIMAMTAEVRPAASDDQFKSAVAFTKSLTERNIGSDPFEKAEINQHGHPFWLLVCDLQGDNGPYVCGTSISRIRDIAVLMFFEGHYQPNDIAAAKVIRAKAVDFLSSVDGIDGGVPLNKMEKAGGKLVGPMEYVSQGVAFLEKGSHEKAVEYLEEAIKLDPNEAMAYFYRGGVLGQMRRPDKVIDDFDVAIKLQPMFSKAFFNRGNSYGEKKELDKAISDFTEAVRLDPGEYKGYANRGLLLSEKGNHVKAIDDFTEAVRLKPQFPDAFFGRSKAYDDLKKFDLAIADYSEAIRLNPRYGSALVNRGSTYIRKREFDKAIDDFSEAIRINPKDGMAYYNRGLAYHRKKEYEKAIENYDQAIQVEPTLRGLPDYTKLVRKD
jgi:tetratricopeptide (TPR) repeat protein